MKRKIPGYIRLLAHTRSILDIPGVRDIRTASSLFMTKEERESLKLAVDFRGLGSEVRRERDKFACQDAAVAKFQKDYLKAREKLAARINKNRAFMALRHGLQKRRRMGEDPDLEGGDTKEAKASISQADLNEIELRY